MSEKVIVALDGMNRKEALDTASRLTGAVSSGALWGFKVNDLLVQCGLEIVRELKKFGRVFADPKLHDIPNTVGNSVRVIREAGADLITIHASGGPEMIRAAVKEAGDARILSVTVLTSISDEEAMTVFGKPAAPSVAHFAKLAAGAGSHGIVCSPKELSLLTEFKQLIKVTPGVRPSWYGKADDQSRTMTPKEAVALGATYLVIGRPITGHSDPLEAVRLIAAELAE